MNKKSFEGAVSFIRTGFPNSAIYILNQVLKNNPDDEIAWILKYYCIEDDSKKLEIIDRIIQTNPKNTEANDLKKGIINGVEHFISTMDKNEFSPDFHDNKNITNTSYIAPDLAKENIKQVVRSHQAKSTPTKKSVKNKEAKEKSQMEVVSSMGTKSNRKKKNTNEICIQQIDNLRNTKTTLGINASRLDTGMFGDVIIVDGVKFTPYIGPSCLRLKKEFDETECEYCEYFSPRDCLLKYDDNLAEDLSRFTRIQEEKRVTQIKRSKIVSHIIHEELLKHGRPLHYSMIAKIIIGRYPKFHLTEKSIRKFMEWHPELFERIDEGVYQAK